MQSINKIFNQIFQTTSENYVSGHEAISNCHKKFSVLRDRDDIGFKVYLYFFPVTSVSEKNEDNFWFLRYKDDNTYDEYDFAGDLLQSYFEYLTNKNKDGFEEKIKVLILKFDEYKHFIYYIFNMQGYSDNLMSTVAYFTKDSSYFKESFKAFVSSESIQSMEFINSIKELVQKKIKDFDLIKKVEKLEEKVSQLSKDLETKEIQKGNLQNETTKLAEELANKNKTDKDKTAQLKNLQENKIKMDSEIRTLREDKIQRDSQFKAWEDDKKKIYSQLDFMNSQIAGLQDDKKKLTEQMQQLQIRIDKIDLRDTLKMCFKYLYLILKSNFKEMKEVNQFWDEIKEIKKILSMDKFKKFNYIDKFINDLVFTGLNPLNTAAHDSSVQYRKIEDIKKYLIGNASTDYDKVVNFFESLPHVYEFIDLFIMFYKSPSDAELEFETKKIKFSDVYNQIFGNL